MLRSEWVTKVKPEIIFKISVQKKKMQAEKRQYLPMVNYRTVSSVNGLHPSPLGLGMLFQQLHQQS